MKDANNSVSIVILNYRTADLILDCLDSLLSQAIESHASVVVVDNRSQDGSAEKIQSWINEHSAESHVQLVESARNGGFAAGNNIGIRSKKADYYLLVNSDTLFKKDALKNMLKALSSDDSVGMVSPRLQWPDGIPQESCFRFHRPMSQLLSSSNLGLVRSLYPKSEVAKRIVQGDSDNEWTSFACIMIKSAVIEQVGLLDEKFFMYFEDVEFCKRAADAGWKIRNHPLAKVVHLRGGSSPVKENKRQRKRQARYFYESRARYFYLLYGHLGLFSANILWTVGWLVALTRSLIQKNFQVPSCKNEWKDIWINFSNPKRQFVHPDQYK